MGVRNVYVCFSDLVLGEVFGFLRRLRRVERELIMVRGSLEDGRYWVG